MRIIICDDCESDALATSKVFLMFLIFILNRLLSKKALYERNILFGVMAIQSVNSEAKEKEKIIWLGKLLKTN